MKARGRAKEKFLRMQQSGTGDIRVTGRSNRLSSVNDGTRARMGNLQGPVLGGKIHLDNTPGSARSVVYNEWEARLLQDNQNHKHTFSPSTD